MGLLQDGDVKYCFHLIITADECLNMLTAWARPKYFMCGIP